MNIQKVVVLLVVGVLVVYIIYRLSTNFQNSYAKRKTTNTSNSSSSNSGTMLKSVPPKISVSSSNSRPPPPPPGPNVADSGQVLDANGISSPPSNDVSKAHTGKVIEEDSFLRLRVLNSTNLLIHLHVSQTNKEIHELFSHENYKIIVLDGKPLVYASQPPTTTKLNQIGHKPCPNDQDMAYEYNFTDMNGQSKSTKCIISWDKFEIQITGQYQYGETPWRDAGFGDLVYHCLQLINDKFDITGDSNEKKFLVFTDRPNNKITWMDIVNYFQKYGYIKINFD
jgi:hypothetical protein